MIRFLLRRGLAKFEAEHDYDATYLREIAESWPAAAIRLQALSLVSQMKGPAPEVWAGALLASTLDGDCGPCVQLSVGFARRAGVPAQPIAACLAGRPETAGDTGLGFRFARAVIADLPEAEALRAEIRAAHGERAVIAAAFAAASGRVYPMLKRAMGHGQTCRQVEIDGVVHPVARVAP